MNQPDNNKSSCLANFHPDALLRLDQIIGGATPLLGVRKTKLYDLVKIGRFPAPIKLGRTSLWRASDVLEALRRLAAAGEVETPTTSTGPKY